ncbi:hypothetical protein RI367_000081 [Sorochytrium milnesiophthora]
MASAAAPTLTTLPPEICWAVFLHLSEADGANLIRVNRAAHRIWEAALYHTLTLRTEERLDGVLQTLTGTYALRQLRHVRCLQLVADSCTTISSLRLPIRTRQPLSLAFDAHSKLIKLILLCIELRRVIIFSSWTSLRDCTALGRLLANFSHIPKQMEVYFVGFLIIAWDRRKFHGALLRPNERVLIAQPPQPDSVDDVVDQRWPATYTWLELSSSATQSLGQLSRHGRHCTYLKIKKDAEWTPTVQRAVIDTTGSSLQHLDLELSVSSTELCTLVSGLPHLQSLNLLDTVNVEKLPCLPSLRSISVKTDTDPQVVAQMRRAPAFARPIDILHVASHAGAERWRLPLPSRPRPTRIAVRYFPQTADSENIEMAEDLADELAAWHPAVPILQCAFGLPSMRVGSWLPSTLRFLEVPAMHDSLLPLLPNLHTLLLTDLRYNPSLQGLIDVVSGLPRLQNLVISQSDFDHDFPNDVPALIAQTRPLRACLIGLAQADNNHRWVWVGSSAVNHSTWLPRVMGASLWKELRNEWLYPEFTP